jgi:hypothetical protein
LDYWPLLGSVVDHNVGIAVRVQAISLHCAGYQPAPLKVTQSTQSQSSQSQQYLRFLLWLISSGYVTISSSRALISGNVGVDCRQEMSHGETSVDGGILRE